MRTELQNQHHVTTVVLFSVFSSQAIDKKNNNNDILSIDKLYIFTRWNTITCCKQLGKASLFTACNCIPTRENIKCINR